ncbi:MAG: flagellar assembly protein FliH [Anaerohalosphaeraceae bacterium]|nr:flagellar assembly protein FliH [Anaerohalosphaeraceae bacterium]
MPAISFSKSIGSVSVLQEYSKKIPAAAGAAEQQSPAGVGQNATQAELNAQENSFKDLCGKTQGLISKLNKYQSEMVANHKVEIARLVIEIARKILIKKVEDKDYDIQEMIKAALENSAISGEITVRLNPQDMLDFKKAMQNAEIGEFKGANLVEDVSIGKAEFVIESPKGSIKSQMEEHLEQIGKALVP